MRKQWMSCRGLLALSALVWLLVPVAPAEAACTSCTPATPVPADRWDLLEPRAIPGDTTAYTFHYEPGCNEPFWFDIDVEAGLVFAATGSKLEIWDARSSPDAPQGPGSACKPVLGLWKKTDQDFYLTSLDAPPGVNTIVALGLEGGMGLVVVDSTVPNDPLVRYQDEGPGAVALSIRDLVATTVGGRHYALVTDEGLDVYAYDLSSAQQLASPCFDDSGTACPGVFKGQLKAGTTPLRTLWKLAGVDQFIALRNGAGAKAQVWDVGAFLAGLSDPILVGEVGPFPQGLAMWRQGGTVYLGAAYGQEVGIFSIPCAGTGTCTPILERTLATPGGLLPGGNRSAVDTVEVSQDGGRTYLYAGSTTRVGTGPQRDYLFDITSIAGAEDLTPQVHPDGYWGWYYQDNPTGFNNVAGYGGVVANEHFYRAAWSIFDIHAILGARPPTADFTWQPTGTLYGGDTVSFFDGSSAEPTSWAWTFEWNGSPNPPPDLTIPNPSYQYVFDAGLTYPRAYDVYLKACNAIGCDDTSQRLTLQDPRPSLGGVTANVTSASQCNTVTFGPSGAAGKPPFTHAWRVLDSGLSPIGATGSSPTFEWQIGANQAPGNYRGELVLSNSFGSSTAALSPNVTVSSLPALGDPTASHETPDFGTVQFHVSDQGATKWTWNFGDGTIVTYTDPVVGPNPVHTYTVGFTTYTVTVTVENCRPADGQRSHSIQVQIGEVVSLEINDFRANGGCFNSGGTCYGDTSTPISFYVDVTGDPTLYEYDWNGDGQFEDTTTGPPTSSVVSHTYTQTGTFKPKLRVRKGQQTAEFTHVNNIGISAGTPPTVSVSGSTSVTVNQTASYGASTQNCSPGSWTWSTGGGQGSSTSNTIQISWSSTGTKTVQATATGGTCSNVSGTRTVQVLPEGGGGGGGGGGSGQGGLEARFTHTPQSPLPGQPVNFDASSSLGGPAGYYWTFGDGSEAGPLGTGTVQHTYAQAGTYNVTLEVSKFSAACPASLCTHSTSRTITVGQGTSGPQGTCASGPTTLCLHNQRFAVEVDWETTEGETGEGKVVGAGTPESGLFYFFNPENWEMLVKVLDACSFSEHVWVFAASTTNVGFELTVTDTITGKSKTYENPVGASAPAITDTMALEACDL